MKQEFCNVSLFFIVFCIFPEILIDKTTFTEFEEICKKNCEEKEILYNEENESIYFNWFSSL